MSALRGSKRQSSARRYIPVEPEPISFAKTSEGASRAGIAIINLAIVIGSLLVMADPDGRVFAIPHTSERARLYGARHPSWIVGVFNRNASPPDIAEAILATREQL